MDPFHERLARVALDATGSFGFALAGGYAVQAHGFLDRMSADVDLSPRPAPAPTLRRQWTSSSRPTSATGHDPGFDQSWFAEALAAIDRLPDRLFQAYGMSPDDTAALRERMHAWARQIKGAE